VLTLHTPDDQNQLTREDNQPQKKTFVYTYDYAGNRTSKKTYTYTTGSLTDLSYTEIKYEYTNDWGDQLTKVGSTSIAYDAQGNPTTYNGYALTWEGRQLMEMESSSRVVSFAYTADGLRTRKTVNASHNIPHTS
jgi:YD repeat-containing protein